MIGYIEFDDAPKIGNLILDFCDDAKKVYDTIVLAGENGTGKTSILFAIKAFIQGAFLQSGSVVKRIEFYDTQGKKHIVRKEDESSKHYSYISSEQDFYQARYELEKKYPDDIRNRKVVYSEARTGFETMTIESESQLAQYEDENDRYETNGDDYSGIVRLLRDIEDEDNNRYIQYAKNNPESKYQDYINNYSRIIRFKRAFEEMFDELTYIGKNVESDDKSIYFEKRDMLIDIDNLSTGEKQIVFRGADLLNHVSDGAIVLVDEPELSLHPKWQMKILNYYRNLLADKNGKQKAQLIIATHSQYIVKSAINMDNVQVNILRKEDGDVIVDTMDESLIRTASEINYLAFNIEEREYFSQLFSTIHGKLQDDPQLKVDDTIKSIDEYIKNHKSFIKKKHEKIDFSHGHYYTLPVYIRNAIYHAESNRVFSNEELKTSIDLLRVIYKDFLT